VIRPRPVTFWIAELSRSLSVSNIFFRGLRGAVVGGPD
jgi:hypothetical protein